MTAQTHFHNSMPLNHTTYYKLRTTSSEDGVTLVEILIYIVLFSFIMSTMLVSINQVLSYSYTASSKSSIEQEGTFILAKINWTLNNIVSVDTPLPNYSGASLTVTKSTGSVTISESGGNIYIGPDILNSSRATIASVSFEHIQKMGATTTDSVKASFSINGKYFETYRTIR